MYLAKTGVSVALWAVSLSFTGPTRYVLWGVAVMVGAVGALLGTAGDNTVPLHIEHLPERFGLLVIHVLGEAVGGAATGVHDASWAGTPVLIGVAGFAVAAALWWIYFDHTAASSVNELEAADSNNDPGSADAPGSRLSGDPGHQDHPHPDPNSPDSAVSRGQRRSADNQRHDLFTYVHPLTLGIAMAGVGVADLAVHPEQPALSTGGWLLAAGISLYLFGSAAITGGTSRTWASVWPWPLAAAPVAVIMPVFPHDRGLLLTAGYAALMVGVAAVGTMRNRRTAVAGQPE